jgi:hypothetical protein
MELSRIDVGISFHARSSYHQVFALRPRIDLSSQDSFVLYMSCGTFNILFVRV